MGLEGRSGEVSQARTRGSLSDSLPLSQDLGKSDFPEFTDYLNSVCCCVVLKSSYFLLSCRNMGVDIIFIFSIC